MAVNNIKLHKLKSLIKQCLCEVIADVPHPPAVIVNHEYDHEYRKEFAVVIACLILEATGEGKTGMQAVMNVIQNRAGKSKNIHDLAKQVLKPYQFSAFNDVTVHNKKELHDLLIRSSGDPNWELAIDIVHAATRGSLIDITDGATHYYAAWMDEKRPPKWSSVFTFLKKIGNHKFYKEDKKLTESVEDSTIHELYSLLDASDKFDQAESPDVENIIRRTNKFIKKWNRPPLTLREKEEIKRKIRYTKHNRYKKLYKNK